MKAPINRGQKKEDSQKRIARPVRNSYLSNRDAPGVLLLVGERGRQVLVRAVGKGDGSIKGEGGQRGRKLLHSVADLGDAWGVSRYLKKTKQLLLLRYLQEDPEKISRKAEPEQRRAYLGFSYLSD